MAEMTGGSRADGDAHRNDDGRHVALEPKHKIFLSHSGAQKHFVEYLCDELERCHRYPFFDLLEESLSIGENFPSHIFRAINQCYVGVVILSEEFLTSKWPMMELVAMVEEAKKRDDFKVIPVFLRISLADLENVENQKRWRECWRELAVKNPGRVVVEDWEAALKYIRPLNSLLKKGERDMEFMKVVVDKICGVAPVEVKLEDSDMEGRSRLCKVIQDKIDLLVESTSMGVCMVGLYGTGGMGKTTLCKALCNEFFSKFRGRVCHAELERVSEEALLRDVLRRLSNTREEVLHRLNKSEMRRGLKEGTFIKDPVFLALDNMSDSRTSINEAKGYVLAKLPVGSIVLVTSRYKDSLLHLMSNMDDRKCLKMPELEVEEAKCLLVKSSEGRIEDDMELMERCVQRCRFYDDDNKSYHYHPLALEVLGRELAEVDDRKEFEAKLGLDDRDIGNQSNGRDEHPIFSILRKSFDTLPKEDQLLFMDVALYLPYVSNFHRGVNMFEWLGMVHRLREVEDVRKGLERLRRKSLLESIGDGRSWRSTRMHDLWRAFCIAETRIGDSKVCRWVYERGTCDESSLCEMSPSGNCWENVKRMALLKFTCVDLGRVNLAHFCNLIVLKITLGYGDKGMVDLSGLTHLKSLEIEGHVQIRHGLLDNLLFLSLFRVPLFEMLPHSISENMGNLKELQILQCSGPLKVWDMRYMISLRKVILRGCENVVTISGFWPDLQVLDIYGCSKLQRCPGVGELVLLEELSIVMCDSLESLPNLGKLWSLRKLKIRSCPEVTKLPGLSDLVALEELHTTWCRMIELEDMSKLTNLQVLNLQDSNLITAASSPGNLNSFHTMAGDFSTLGYKFSIGHLTKLHELQMKGWGFGEIEALENLRMLKHLNIRSCNSVNKVPSFQSLTQLHHLSIYVCEFTDVSALSNMMELKTLKIGLCPRLVKLPNLQRLTSMTELKIVFCPQLLHWDYLLVPQDEAELCATNALMDSPSHHLVMKLETLNLRWCGLRDLTCIRGFSLLQYLSIDAIPIRELPNLANFPFLVTLLVEKCESLVGLVSHNPMNSLRRLGIRGCSSLATLPNLSINFPRLFELEMEDCDGIRLLCSSEPLTTLTRLELTSCNSLTELPDLSMFPALEELKLDGCSELISLSMAEPLAALHSLYAKGCRNLSWDDLEHVRALCPQCALHSYEDLTGGDTSEDALDIDAPHVDVADEDVSDDDAPHANDEDEDAQEDEQEDNKRIRLS